MEFTANNYYPVIPECVVIEKGENKVNWTVAPYVRILDTQVSYDSGERKI